MSGRTRDHPRYVPRFEVTVGDRTLSEPGGELADMVVETTLSGADRFQFTLAHRFDGRRESFTDLSWDTVSVGTDVRIDAGYASDSSLTTLFVGQVGSITAEFAAEAGPSVQVAGYGLLRQTMRGTRSDSWSETTIGAVVEDVLSAYDFTTVEVENASQSRQRLLQHAQTDHGFLRDLASTYGASFHARRETARFVPGTSIEDSESPDVTLTYGDDLASFRAETSPTPTGAQVRAWNPNRAAVDVVTESADSGDSGTSTSSPGTTSGGAVGSGADDSGHEVFAVPAMPESEAKRIAAQKAGQLTDAAVSGYGRADGTPAIQAGATVELDGLGDRFSGAYCVTSATHRLGSDGYRTTFDARAVAE